MAGENTDSKQESDNKMRVLVPVDGSENAEIAYEFYLKKIHQPDNQVIFAHSTEPPHIGAGISESKESTFLTGTQFSQRMQEKREEVDKLLKHYINLHPDKKIDYKVHAVEFVGNPGEAIVRMARDEKADMIVMGSRGMGVIRRTILGSVSDYVTQHAHCPVLLCQKPEEETESSILSFFA